jgi:hypothetical protein
MDDTALSATRFVANQDRARVGGLTMRGARGLLEDQERFLSLAGVLGTF